MEFKHFNLQLFADLNPNTTKDNVIGNDLSPTMKTYYNTQLLENSRDQLFFSQFAKKQPLPKNGGNSVEWRKIDQFAPAMKPLTEGVTPDGNKVNMTKITAEIEQYGDYTTVTDRLDLEAVDPIIMMVTEEHGAQAGLTLDTLDRNEAIKGTSVMYAGGKTSRYALTGNDIITGRDVNKWATFLKKMKAPKVQGNEYVAIIHPSVTEDLRNDPQWLEAHKYASPEEIFNGEIGKLHNIRFVESTNQKVYCGANLAGETRNLRVSASASGTDKVSFDGGTVADDELAGRLVLIGGGCYEVATNTATQLTLVECYDNRKPASVTASTGDIIYPGEGGAEGCAVYAVLCMGKDAYGEVEPSAESLEVIVKQRGSAGTQDPLDQRATVGWKASTAAKILYEQRMIRFECGSSYSGIDEGN